MQRPAQEGCIYRECSKLCRQSLVDSVPLHIVTQLSPVLLCRAGLDASALLFQRMGNVGLLFCALTGVLAAHPKKIKSVQVWDCGIIRLLRNQLNY